MRYNGGITFFGLLTVVFIILKLTGVIDWPWLAVLSPICVSAMIVLVIIVLLAIIIAVEDL